MKIAILGDVHYAENVTSRLDLFYQTVLDKLDEVFSKFDVAVCVGDLMNAPTTSMESGLALFSRLSNYKRQGKRFITILGNHDVYNDREDTIGRTFVGLLEKYGVIEVLKPHEPIEIDNLLFHSLYIDNDKAREEIKNFPKKLDKNNIIISHNYFECEYDGLNRNDFDGLDVKIFFGHEHKPLKHFDRFYRCGALTRTTANDYNTCRMPYYYVIDSMTSDVEAETVDCAKNPEDVYRKDKLERQNLAVKHFEESVHDTTLMTMEKVLDNYSGSINSETTIKQALLELQAPEYALARIKSKYVMLGEKFE